MENLMWKKSSACEGGACVEVALPPPGKECESIACVEVAFRDGTYFMRNSQDPAVALKFTPAEWDAFREGVLRDEFNLA